MTIKPGWNGRFFEDFTLGETIAHASPRTIDRTVSGASSWMRSDHGGSRLERSRNASRARGPSSRPAIASIRKA